MPLDTPVLQISASSVWTKCAGSVYLVSKAMYMPSASMNMGNLADSLLSTLLYPYDENRDESLTEEANDLKVKALRSLLGAENSALVGVSAEYIVQIYLEGGDSSKLYTQAKVDTLLGSAGFIDVVIETEKTTYILDYKNGAGIQEKAYNNSQLLLYARFYEKQVHQNSENYSLIILQPRMPFGNTKAIYDRFELHYSDMIAMSNAVLIKAYEISSGKTTLVTGTHCRKCNGRSICRELANTSLQIIGDELETLGNGAEDKLVYKELNELKDSEVVSIYENLDLVRSFLKAVDTSVSMKAIRHQVIRGHKIVKGSDRLSWKNPDEKTINRIKALLKEKGVKVSSKEVSTTKVITPTQFRNIFNAKIGKEETAIVLEALAGKKEGALLMVHKSDTRPSVGSKAERVFEVINRDSNEKETQNPDTVTNSYDWD